MGGPHIPKTTHPSRALCKAGTPVGLRPGRGTSRCYLLTRAVICMIQPPAIEPSWKLPSSLT